MGLSSSIDRTRLTLPRRLRLGHALEFKRVYDCRVKKVREPMQAHGKPNSKPYWRLGLSVGRVVGGAVERHRVKRLFREAFRLEQHALPMRADGGYDLVLGCRAHAPVGLDEIRRMLLELAESLHKEWARRDSRRES